MHLFAVFQSPSKHAPDCDHVLIFVQVLAAIGEQFSEGEEICGVAVNVRQRGDRVDLWTRTASNEAAQVKTACDCHEHP